MARASEHGRFSKAHIVVADADRTSCGRHHFDVNHCVSPEWARELVNGPSHGASLCEQCRKRAVLDKAEEGHYAMTKPAKPAVHRQRVRCVSCGRRHALRAAYVGYEDQALCVTCEPDYKRPE